MKIKRHPLVYMAYAIIYTTLTPPTWASSEVIKHGFGATLVCPFNVINGPKSIGNVVIACYSNTSCPTPSLIGNAAWGGRGGGTPTLQNGSHTLSNDAMTSVGLTSLTTTVSIQLEVHNAANTAYSNLCMEATVVGGVFNCTGGPYTLDIGNL